MKLKFSLLSRLNRPHIRVRLCKIKQREKQSTKFQAAQNISVIYAQIARQSKNSSPRYVSYQHTHAITSSVSFVSWLHEPATRKQERFLRRKIVLVAAAASLWSSKQSHFINKPAGNIRYWWAEMIIKPSRIVAFNETERANHRRAASTAPFSACAPCVRGTEA